MFITASARWSESTSSGQPDRSFVAGANRGKQFESFSLGGVNDCSYHLGGETLLLTINANDVANLGFMARRRKEACKPDQPTRGLILDRPHAEAVCSLIDDASADPSGRGLLIGLEEGAAATCHRVAKHRVDFLQITLSHRTNQVRVVSMGTSDLIG